MKTANPILLTVEYLFVAISMVGIAITAFTQEITFAAIPLIITVLLNIFNRQQVEENILALEKQILEKQQEVSEETIPVNSSQEIQEVEGKVKNLESAIAQFKEDLQQLSVSFNPSQFKSQINDFQECLNSFNAVDIIPLEQEIIQLRQQLDSLTQVQGKYEALEQSLQEYKSEIHNLFNSFQALPSRSELEDLKQSIDSIMYLKNEMNNRVTWESFNSLSSQLNNLVEQFNHRPEPEAIQNLSKSLTNLDFNQFGEQLKNLREQFDSIPQKDLVETLNQLQEKLDNLEDKQLTNKSKSRTKLRQKSKLRRVRVNQRKR